MVNMETIYFIRDLKWRVEDWSDKVTAAARKMIN